jgi:two-component system, LytTR family, response regulator LytT
MKVLIIEDEAAALNSIKNILGQLDASMEIAGCFDTVLSSVDWFRNNPSPDLIFMDIHLADGSAFNIFECVTIEAPIIFTTAYDQYAINAFQVNSVDYILKPITIEKVKNALDKLKRINLHHLQTSIQQIDKLLRPSEYTQRILIPLKDKIFPLRLEDIAYFYNTFGTTEVITKNQAIYKVNKSLDALMPTLDPAHFFRANRQFIIAKEFVLDITLWFDSRLLINLKVETPEKIYVSKNKSAEFKKWFSL